MRTPNYYTAAGFERAGLRRREPEWIRARVADAASVFVPVWRNQNLVVEVEGGEPRAVVLAAATLAEVSGNADDRLGSGDIVFLGVVDERAHFALDVSGVETPLETLRSPALAA